jgi:lipoprotein-anchoring transpeptidase ErfK/SrfK
MTFSLTRRAVLTGAAALALGGRAAAQSPWPRSPLRLPSAAPYEDWDQPEYDSGPPPGWQQDYDPYGEPTRPSSRQRPVPDRRIPGEPRPVTPISDFDPRVIYGPVRGEPFAVPALNLSLVNPAFLRRLVAYQGGEAPGTIIVDPQAHYLYAVQGNDAAVRYGVGVGRTGFGWAGVATIKEKREWPDWYPPKEMLQRQPELMARMAELQGGLGMPGGPGNPLGARAMYLWQANKDTLYRLHGTVEPASIGKSVSSGCIRLINQDAIDLYARTPVDAKVVVLGAADRLSSRSRSG